MTWTDFETEAQALANKITFSPDMIIGVVRGGLIPARLLSTLLSVKNMHCLSIKKTENGREVSTDILESVQGKKVLLVEDMLETGKSMITAKAYLQSKGAEVKTACLYVMPMTEITPDYFLTDVPQIISFPWE